MWNLLIGLDSKISKIDVLVFFMTASGLCLILFKFQLNLFKQEKMNYTISSTCIELYTVASLGEVVKVLHALHY